MAKRKPLTGTAAAKDPLRKRPQRQCQTHKNATGPIVNRTVRKKNGPNTIRGNTAVRKIKGSGKINLKTTGSKARSKSSASFTDGNTKTEGGDYWTYHQYNGWKQWPQRYKENVGTSQSPINLDRASIKKNSSLTPFIFNNFNVTPKTPWNLVNNEHSVVVPCAFEGLTFEGGGLEDLYAVEQFHFHWGSQNCQGSEHTIDNKAYAMEFHLVAYNQKYGNINNALKHFDGLAVLGALFKVQPESNMAYEPIVKMLKKVREPNSTVPMPALPLNCLLPGNPSQYFRYQGSLTTPPCNEVVTWTIFNQILGISQKQLEEFRELYCNEKDEATGKHFHMVDNCRPVQELHGRRVTSSF